MEKHNKKGQGENVHPKTEVRNISPDIPRNMTKNTLIIVHSQNGIAGMKND